MYEKKRKKNHGKPELLFLKNKPERFKLNTEFIKKSLDVINEPTFDEQPTIQRIKKILWKFSSYKYGLYGEVPKYVSEQNIHFKRFQPFSPIHPNFYLRETEGKETFKTHFPPKLKGYIPNGKATRNENVTANDTSSNSKIKKIIKIKDGEDSGEQWGPLAFDHKTIINK